MGNDGGSIPKRTDLVKEKPKEIKIDQEITAKAKANYCTLTKQKLKKPVAACKLGFLYNKEPLLKALIEKTLTKEFEHITSLKDIVTINIMDNDKKNAEFPFICPITRIEFNGMNKFVLIWACGCVFSEKILQETKNVGVIDKKSSCAVCNKPYTKDDVISLNMTPEQQAISKNKILEQKELARNKKKANKVEKNNAEEDSKKKLEKDQHEPDLQKKLKCNTSMLQTNILDKIADPEFQTIKNIENNSVVFKSLFHQDYKIEDNLVFHNVRHGLR